MDIGSHDIDGAATSRMDVGLIVLGGRIERKTGGVHVLRRIQALQDDLLATREVVHEAGKDAARKVTGQRLIAVRVPRGWAGR